ncbi:MAG: hypothetical protein M8872_08255 [marine benthic group bacterium]|nr:hypothetical protein [Gemmatimonadota bacterium]
MITRCAQRNARTGPALWAALASVIGLLAWTGSAYGQDSHYWNQQYGPRASLLSGSVIGSVGDISGTFYNPGALGVAGDLAFAISADVYEYESVTIEDGAGRGIDLGTTRSGVRPSLIAGTFTRTLFGQDVLAYSILTRARSSSDISTEIISSGPEIPPELDLDELVGVGRVDGSFNETWVGVSYAHPFSSSFGLGVTGYVAHRTQRRRTEGIVEALAFDGSPSVDIDVRGGNYSTFRTLAKLGGYFTSESFSAGLTFTTPSLHIAGSGEFGINQAVFTSDTTVLLATVQPDLSAEYKSPLSVGFGFGWQLGNARINASGEWFDGVDPYVVMQGEEVIQQVPPQPIAFDVVQSMDEVFNWGVGLEYAFRETLSGYASFATDASGFTDEIDRADLSLNTLNLYSAFVGADFRVSSARFTLGVGYGWGSEPAPGLVELIPDEDIDLDPRYVYSRLRLLFGFELGVD